MTTTSILYRAQDEITPTEAHVYQLADGRYDVRMFDTESAFYFSTAHIFQRLDAACAYADAVCDRPRCRFDCYLNHSHRFDAETLEKRQNWIWTPARGWHDPRIPAGWDVVDTSCV